MKSGLTKTFFIIGILFASALAVAAQAEKRAEPSFEISLQLVIGSNDRTASRSDLPVNLTSVSKQLRTNFNFSDFRLASTFLGRVSNNGNYEYKSVANIFGQEPANGSQTFLDWSVVNLTTIPNAKGQNAFQAQSFRFGARVPVITNAQREEGGKNTQSINYEAIGVNLNKIGVPENVPTLVGTLNLPGANGTIFLLMTIRSVDL